MKSSNLFGKTIKEKSKEADNVSSELLLRGQFIDKLASGIYTLLPLGLRVQRKIEEIIRQEMDALGGRELSMPVLQPKELWQKTGRWTTIDPPLFKVKDRHSRELALGSTHEEVVTDLVRRRLHSYADLPLFLYQIQTKFRNEMRTTGGLLRTREFLMKDGYSFHCCKEDLDKFYQKVAASYFNIFKKCGLEAVMVEAHSGSIGGEESNEFMVLAETGEDKILLCECGFAANAEMKIEKCPKCGKQMMTKNAIEIAHIFKLNDLYSKKMNVKFVDKDGKQKFYQMGCYGIGVDRLLATIVEVHHDERGIIWPRAIAPYDAQLLEIQNPAKQDLASRDKSQNPKSRIQNTASDIYQELTKAGVSVLYDDRENVSAGEKFADADLLGMSIRIVVSEKSLEKGGAEVKKRGATESEIVALGDLAGKLKN